jgi:hypothetical protein
MTFEEAHAKIADEGLLLAHLFEINPKKVNHDERWRAAITTGQGGDMWVGTSTQTAAAAIEDALEGYRNNDRRACGPAPGGAKPDEKRKKASKAKPKKAEPEPEREKTDEEIDAELAEIL